MANFLRQLINPQINHGRFFTVMRDFRKGGLNPTMFDDFMQTIQTLPALYVRTGELTRIWFNKERVIITFFMHVVKGDASYWV